MHSCIQFLPVVIGMELGQSISGMGSLESGISLNEMFIWRLRSTVTHTLRVGVACRVGVAYRMGVV